MTPEPPASGDGVPVTVLGGYLGAGKTTLVNALLRGAAADDHRSPDRGRRRLAVLVNDFGSINVDAALIDRHDGQTMTLQNGCICCSTADAMGDAMDRVLAHDPRPEHIVIEASGVADPVKVAHYGRGWPGCRLDSVIVLASAADVRRLAQDRFVGPTVLRQLAGADLVVPTLSDEPTSRASSHRELRRWLGDRSTAALVVEPRDLRVHGESLAPLVFGGDERTRAFDEQTGVVAGEEAGPLADGPLPDAASIFSQHRIGLRRSVTVDELESVLAALPDGVARLKGLVRTEDLQSGASVRLVQRVGRRLELSVIPAPAGPSAVEDQLIVIAVGAQVTAEAIHEAFAPLSTG